MGRWRLLPGRSARPGVLFALLALALNVIVPAGFMVGQGPAGASIVICTGHGPQTLTRHADGLGHTPGHPPPHHNACPFAGHGVVAGPGFVAIVARQSLPLSVAGPTTVADMLPGRGLAAPPPPSRGPPSRLM
jgi:hypothetical protein